MLDFLENFMNTWTIIKVGIANERHFSAFHVQGALSHDDAVAHALNKINSDWSNQHSDYLRNCIGLGNYKVVVATEQ